MFDGGMTPLSRVPAFDLKRRTPVVVVSMAFKLTRRDAFTSTFGFLATRTVVRRTVADGLVIGASLNLSIRSSGFFEMATVLPAAVAVGPDTGLLNVDARSRPLSPPGLASLCCCSWCACLCTSAASEKVGRMGDVVRAADVKEACLNGSRAASILFCAVVVVVLVTGGREDGTIGHASGFTSGGVAASAVAGEPCAAFSPWATALPLPLPLASSRAFPSPVFSSCFACCVD